MQVVVPGHGAWVAPLVLRSQLWDRDRCAFHCLRSGICFCTVCIRSLSFPKRRRIILEGCLRSTGKISSLHIGQTKVALARFTACLKHPAQKYCSHFVSIRDPRIALQMAQLKSSLTSSTNSKLSPKFSVQLMHSSST